MPILLVTHGLFVSVAARAIGLRESAALTTLAIAFLVALTIFAVHKLATTTVQEFLS